MDVCLLKGVVEFVIVLESGCVLVFYLLVLVFDVFYVFYYIKNFVFVFLDNVFEVEDLYLDFFRNDYVSNFQLQDVGEYLLLIFYQVFD